MTVHAPKLHSFTVEEYHRMADAGIFTEDDRVELIEGEVVEMAAIGSRHAACVDTLNRRFVLGGGDRVVVRIQNPVTLGDLSEPEPDVVLATAKPGGYASAHPTVDEVLLIVEVSDSSLDFDDRVKLPLYARHGIGEVWRADLASETVAVHRDPAGESYRSVTTARRHDTLRPEALPDVEIPVDDLFGPRAIL